MASFPELLYVPAPSDVLKAITVPARYVWDTDISAAQAVISSIGVTVPKDRVLRVTALSIVGIGGGAQTWDGIELFAQNELATFAHYILNEPIVITSFNQDVDVLLMPEERLQIRASFSAGAVANRLIASVWGFMYPRANVQHAPV